MRPNYNPGVLDSSTQPCARSLLRPVCSFRTRRSAHGSAAAAGGSIPFFGCIVLFAPTLHARECSTRRELVADISILVSQKLTCSCTSRGPSHFQGDVMMTLVGCTTYRLDVSHSRPLQSTHSSLLAELICELLFPCSLQEEMCTIPQAPPSEQCLDGI